MPTAIFGERGHAQVNAMFDRALRKRSEQRIVDHDKRAVPLLSTDFIRNRTIRSKIDYRRRGVCRGLGNDKLQWSLRHCSLRRRTDFMLVRAVKICRRM
jgi:hypothetical protein